MKQRINALSLKRSYTEEKKEKIERCLVLDLMSSEDEEEDGTFSVRPLRWRSAVMDQYVSELDDKIKATKSKKAARQTVQRKLGEMSVRPVPTQVSAECRWAVRKL